MFPASGIEVRTQAVRLEECPISKFPAEILVTIFSFLGGKSLIAAADTCRKWRAVVRDSKKLQSNIDFSKFIYGFKGGIVLDYYISEKKHPSLYLRALAQEPDLRKRYLNLTWASHALQKPHLLYETETAEDLLDYLEMSYDLGQSCPVRELIARYADRLVEFCFKNEDPDEACREICDKILACCLSEGYDCEEIDQTTNIFHEDMQIHFYEAMVRCSYRGFSSSGKMLEHYLTRVELIEKPNTRERIVCQSLKRALINWYAKRDVDRAFAIFESLDHSFSIGTPYLYERASEELQKLSDTLCVFASILLEKRDFEKLRKLLEVYPILDNKGWIKRKMDVQERKVNLRDIKGYLKHCTEKDALLFLKWCVEKDLQKEEAILILKEWAREILESDGSVSPVGIGSGALKVEMASLMYKVGEKALAEALGRDIIEFLLSRHGGYQYVYASARRLLPEFQEIAKEADQKAVRFLDRFSQNDHVQRAYFYAKLGAFEDASQILRAELEKVEYEEDKQDLIYQAIGSLILVYRQFLDKNCHNT